MTSYLERYRRGETRQVWAELAALRSGVGQEPLYADVVAVARETMTRARKNVEILVDPVRGRAVAAECRPGGGYGPRRPAVRARAGARRIAQGQPQRWRTHPSPDP